MFVYLAQPIDQANSEVTLLKRAVLAVQQTLNYEGHSVFRPARAFNVGLQAFTVEYGSEKPSTILAPSPEDLHTIDLVNQDALGRCDAVVAVLPPGVATLGVPAEVELALKLNKPVTLVTTRALVQASVQLNSWVNRGATLTLVDPHDGRLVTDQPWAERLGSLPRPAEFPFGVPPLLVTGQSQNLQVGKYEGDAGLDLAIDRDARLAPGEYQLVTTGVHVAVPQGYFGLITGRSSTWAKHHVRVTQGVIDSGYRGELLVGLLNEHGEAEWLFEKGARLAQFILLPTFQGGLHVVPELPESTRGHAGFGSSGV